MKISLVESHSFTVQEPFLGTACISYNHTFTTSFLLCLSAGVEYLAQRLDNSFKGSGFTFTTSNLQAITYPP